VVQIEDIQVPLVRLANGDYSAVGAPPKVGQKPKQKNLSLEDIRWR